MSNSTVILETTTITGTENTIIVGALLVNTYSLKVISIPPQINENINVIMQKGDDCIFKSLMNSSPVCPYNINLFDQYGDLCNKWNATRNNNSSGNVQITSETKALISSINLPCNKFPDTNYLVISSYDGLRNCALKESKKILVSSDLKMIPPSMKSVILFIADHIKNELDELGFVISDYFSIVHAYPKQNLINTFVEFIVGKNVADSKPSFQGMLNFGSNVEIAAVRSLPVPDISKIKYHIRTGGRLQINTLEQSGAMKFLIVLKHSGTNEIDIVKENLETGFDIINNTVQVTPDLEIHNFKTLFDGIHFFENLNSIKEKNELMTFIKANSSNVALYLFDSPLNVFETINSESELSKNIIEHGRLLRKQINQLLINYASNDFLHKEIGTFKNFNDNELYNMHEKELYNENYKAPQYKRLERWSSVPFSSIKENKLYSTSHGQDMFM